MAITDRLQGFSIGVAVKPPCAVASTGNLILSSSQVIDGIAVGSCERVLVRAQTNAKENGIYEAGEAAWRRTADWDGKKDAIPGTQVYVDRGTTFGRVFFAANSSSTAISIDIGATGDDVTFSQITPSVTDVSAGTVIASGSTAERALDERFAERKNYLDFLADKTGVTDASTRIQDAWNAAVAAGVPAYGPAGTFRLDNPLVVQSSLSVIMDPGCKLVRRFDAAASIGNATFKQTDFGAKLTNVIIVGGELTTESTAFRGMDIALFGDEIRISDLAIRDTIGGACILIGGDQNRIDGVHIETASTITGDDGIRMYGGNDYRCTNCFIKSGDDAYAFSPLAPTQTNEDLSINGVVLDNCVGHSNAARALVVVAIDQDSTGGMDASLSNIHVRNFVGSGVERSLLIQNQDSSGGTISKIDIDGITLDASGDGSTFQAALINKLPGMGDVSDISVKNLVVESPDDIGLEVDGANRVYLDGGFVGATRGAPQGTVIIEDCSDVHLSNMTIEGGSSVDNIVVGNSGLAASRVYISDCNLTEINDGESGIFFLFANQCHATRCTFSKTSGASSDNAFTFSVNSSRCSVTNSDVSQCSGVGVNIGNNHTLRDIVGYNVNESGISTFSNSSQVSVDFEESFGSTNYAVVLGPQSAGDFWVSGIDSTGFTLNATSTDATASISWRAAFETV